MNIKRLSAGEVEYHEWLLPDGKEVRRVYTSPVYHYELRPTGARTLVEIEIEAEAAISDSADEPWPAAGGRRGGINMVRSHPG